jgi:hypothetical protein
MRNTNRLAACALAVAGLAILAGPTARAATVWGVDWTVNGDASAPSASRIVLTPDTGAQVGSAWVTDQIEVTDSTALNAYFEFRISGSDDTFGSGDGMAFLFHNGGDTELGAGGGYLGYGGMGSTLIAVEFDTWSCCEEESAPHVAIHLNGSNVPGGGEAVFATTLPLALVRDSGDSNLHAWIDFDPDSQELRVFLSDSSEKPSAPLLFYALGDSLNTYLGGNEGGSSYARIGFTAATGGAHSLHEVLNFSTTPVPLPAAAWLLLSGLAGVAALGRRKAAA